MTFSAFDHACMSLALRLAEKGLFTTHPNPRVGCVIARQDQVIATGWHQFAGGPHAEILALQSAASEVQESTAYVTLEPCSHHGRTPPCVEALIQAGIARVVIAMEDPNIQVNGAGRRRLLEAGLLVDCGLMAAEAEDLNSGFIMRMREGRPWIRVKIAASLDGRTALQNGVSQWISSAASRQDVQKWRARSSAILTGVGTVLADDPAMTARVEEPPLRPLRVIADTRWRTPVTSRILQHPSSTLIAGGQIHPVPEELSGSGAHCLSLPLYKGRTDLVALLRVLAEKEINEVQVEAGAVLCGSLLQAGLVDEVLLYQAPIFLGDGGPGLFSFGPLESMQGRTHLDVLESCMLGTDLRLRLKPAKAPDLSE